MIRYAVCVNWCNPLTFVTRCKSFAFTFELSLCTIAYNFLHMKLRNLLRCCAIEVAEDIHELHCKAEQNRILVHGNLVSVLPGVGGVSDGLMHVMDTSSL